MIKNDFIQLLLQLDTSHKQTANTGSEYITIGKFVVRIADHLTVKTNTHDLDVIFFDDNNYMIYPTKAMFKKPEYCTTAEDGIEYIKGWLKWGAPYVKGPNDVAGTDISAKPTETIIEHEEIVVTENNTKICYKNFMKRIGWVPGGSKSAKKRWEPLVSAVRALIDYLDDSYTEDLITSFKNCGHASVDRRLDWIKDTFGITDEDIEKYKIQLYITIYDKIRIIQQDTLDYC